MTSGKPTQNLIQISNPNHTTSNHPFVYHSWQSEIRRVLHSHGLLPYLDGSCRPLRYLADGTISAEFLLWKQQDQIIWYWLYTSLPPEIQCNWTKIGCETPLLWQCLHSMCTSNSFPRVLEFVHQLQTIKKVNETSYAQYMVRIRHIADGLRSLGGEISEHYMAICAIQGVNKQFEVYLSTVHSQEELQHLTMVKLERILSINRFYLDGAINPSGQAQYETLSLFQTTPSYSQAGTSNPPASCLPTSSFSPSIPSSAQPVINIPYIAPRKPSEMEKILAKQFDPTHEIGEFLAKPFVPTHELGEFLTKRFEGEPTYKEVPTSSLTRQAFLAEPSRRPSEKQFFCSTASTHLTSVPQHDTGSSQTHVEYGAGSGKLPDSSARHNT